MCGIAGVHCWGDARPTPRMLKDLLLANEIRGKDASGVAWLSPTSGEITIKKDRISPTDMVKSIPESEWEEISSSKTVLLHARAKTKGDPTKNENNHPVYASPYKWIVTHNGTVRNDDDIWYKYGNGIKRFAEVDTSAIPLLLSQSDDFLPYLTLLAGNATFAAWNEHNREHPVLVRFGEHDLFLFLDTYNDILLWSSALMAIDIVPARGVSKLRFVTINKFPDDRALVLGNSLETTKLYKVTRRPFFSPKLVSTGSLSHTFHTTNTTVGTENTKSAKRPTFQWQRPSSSEKALQARPEPLWEKVGFTFMSLGAMHGDFNRTANLTSSTLHTPYGRWVFRRVKNKVDREFLPHKRWKKYLRLHFNEFEKKLYPEMPVSLLVHNSSTVTPWDNMLSFEALMIEEPIGGNKATKLYWICPWCGVFDYSGVWLRRLLRCEFCNIKSEMMAISKGGE